MINEIVEIRIQEKCREFIAELQAKEQAICALASAHHFNGESCSVFGQRRGSYNYCFFVRFDPSGTKWVVRIPILPRLAFVEEKLEAEIAVMIYIATKTTIPIPSIHAYSLGGDNPIKLPYIIMDYKEGRTLQDVGLDTLSSNQKSHLLNQIADVYLQLRQQEFSYIGSLSIQTLDVTNRPLSIEVNDQEMEGLDPSSIWEAGKVFKSARDYYNSIMSLAMNSFMKSRYAVYNRGDAEKTLYSLEKFREHLSSWSELVFDDGPFVLTHGDLRATNLLVHPDSLKLVAILDWEFSCVVPLQMNMPPTWLSGLEFRGICHPWLYDEYMLKLDDLIKYIAEHELRLANLNAPSLSQEWRKASRQGRLLVSGGLNNPPDIPRAYRYIDRRFLKRTEDLTVRIANFLKDDVSRYTLVQRKVHEMRIYKAELWYHKTLSYILKYRFAFSLILGSATILFCTQRPRNL